MATTRTLTIDGMSCDNCVQHVTRALENIPGLRVENVQIGSARISSEVDSVSDQQLISAMEEAGYDARIAGN
ncbi:MAG TPA: heavy-metal-associated domain-containing protein [Bryobacteraceae bacterium]|nr:heavy-metal-associated domain-containing protein [Bryobacteraceae bacterium]